MKIYRGVGSTGVGGRGGEKEDKGGVIQWREFSAYSDGTTVQAEVGSTETGRGRAYWLVAMNINNIGVITSYKININNRATSSSMHTIIQPALSDLTRLSEDIQESSLMQQGCPLSPLELSRESKGAGSSLAFAETQGLLSVDAFMFLQAKCHTSLSLPHIYKVVEAIDRLKKKVVRIRHFISNENLSLFPDFQQR